MKQGIAGQPPHIFNWCFLSMFLNWVVDLLLTHVIYTCSNPLLFFQRILHRLATSQPCCALIKPSHPLPCNLNVSLRDNSEITGGGYFRFHTGQLWIHPVGYALSIWPNMPHTPLPPPHPPSVGSFLAKCWKCMGGVKQDFHN